MRRLLDLLGQLNDAMDKRLGGMFDVELSGVDDGPDYQCPCGRWLPCRHCRPEPLLWEGED